MKRGKRAASLLLALTLVLSYAAVPVFAAGETGDTEKESIPQGNQTEGSWVYEVAEGAMGGPGGGGPGGPGGGGPGGGGGGEPTQEELDAFMAMMMAGGTPEATILWGTGEEKSGNVVMLPATLGGYTVTTVGNGVQNISSNNKNEDVYFLIPEGVTTLSPRMIYDYNSTSGWSIPASVTSISSEPASFLSCPGAFYGESGSAAETYASTDATRDFITYDADGSSVFSVTGGEEGYIQPNGTYHLPSGMLDGKHTVTFHIVADYQYKIKALTVDGQAVADAAGKNTYDLSYTFTTGLRFRGRYL